MKTEVRSSGTSLSTLLFVVFLTLKLTNNIDWSWWWVTSPLWIPAVAILSVLLLLGLVSLIVAAIK